MAQELTAYEVLEIAENMERNAAKFYRKAAGLCDDPRTGKLFSELAQWEQRHIEVLADMKEHWSERTWELGCFAADRIDASPPPVSASSVFSAQADPSKELTGSESRADTLRMAIQKEKDTIAYYTALKEFILGEKDLEVIEGVIREEDRHVRILAQSLEQTA